jgi:MFS transporter, DHA1 family, tetracycline resistance protein
MQESAKPQGTSAVASGPRRAAFIFVFITVLLDMLALGIIVPVLPKLVVDFVAGDKPLAAEVYGLFGTAWALMQFVFSPLHGSLSDRFGRRPLILFSNVGLGLDYILMALAPNLWWLFAGRVISGISSASIATSYAYVADVTPPEQRAGRFGMLGVAFGAGFVLGPALGGLAGNLDPRLPFWIAAGLSLANALYGFLVLPESLPKERRAPLSWRNANPLGALALLRAQPQLLGLAGVNFLFNLAHASLPNIGVLYMMYRYGFDERAVGFTMTAVGICAMVVQGALVGPVVSRFSERAALIAGLSFGVTGFTTFGLATTGTGFLAGIPVLALWGFASPALLGLMSRRVSGSEQGRLQGANASIMGIANLIGPGLFAKALALSVEGGAVELPGAGFLLAALMLVLAIAGAWWSTRPAASRSAH